ncbi:BCCT family transporter [Alkalilimnicola ehrlichii MLHE-1]|uniref:BCCT family transporter n=1 Tax=Alkalilimnicola ehrlichii TaxID=351052 RepID=UPI0002F9CE9C|nr:BCCT family transporter [Alkalilimnicola ehrlichii]
MNPRVFLPAAAVVLALVMGGALWTEPLGRGFESLHQMLIQHFGWVYTTVVALLLGFVLAVLLHPRFRRLRLGPPDSRPEYTYLSWFAMLFSAGMGIGLLFYGVAEPLLHYLEPPHGEGGTAAAADEALRLTFFHWGLHPWAIYIIVALALAFFSYRHDLPLSMRAALYPLIGHRINGPAGDLMDSLAVVGTVLGVATSLGLGVMQVNAGLAHVGLMAVSVHNQILLIVFIMAIATLSVLSGLNNGIRIISRANLFLGSLLLLFVFAAGPTVMMLYGLLQAVGHYVQGLVALTLRTDVFHGQGWQASWTLFYWAWWISWCPFVGMFIARVSRGRTVGEFILGTLLVPTGFTFLWMTVFGVSALEQEMRAGELGSIVQADVAQALFAMLEAMPLATLTVPLATLVIIGYFVTSADSGALVMNILSSGGNPNPPLLLKLFWSLLTGAAAAVLLLAGGLQALQTATLTAALPLSLVLLLMAWGLWTAFRADAAQVEEIGTMPEPGLDRLSRYLRERRARALPPGEAAGLHAPGRWLQLWPRRVQHWLLRRERFKDRQRAAEVLDEAEEAVRRCLDETVYPALQAVAEELNREGHPIHAERTRDGAQLCVTGEHGMHPIYVAQGRVYQRPQFAFPALHGRPERPRLATVHVTSDGLSREWSVDHCERDTLYADALRECRKWLDWWR